MFNDIEMAPESPEKEQQATDPTMEQPRLIMPGSINPDLEKNLAEAVRREFHEKFNPYNSADFGPAREYYKKHRHFF